MAIFGNVRMRVNGLPSKIRWRKNSKDGNAAAAGSTTTTSMKEDGIMNQQANNGENSPKEPDKQGVGPLSHDTTGSYCLGDDDHMSSSSLSSIQEDDVNGGVDTLKRINKPVLTVDIPSFSDSSEESFMGIAKFYRDNEPVIKHDGEQLCNLVVPQTTRSNTSLAPALSPNNLTSPCGDVSNGRCNDVLTQGSNHYYVPFNSGDAKKPDLVAMDICEPPPPVPRLEQQVDKVISPPTQLLNPHAYRGHKRYDMDLDPSIAEQWERWNYSALLEACSRGEYADDMEDGGGAREWSVCHPNHKHPTSDIQYLPPASLRLCNVEKSARLQRQKDVNIHNARSSDMNLGGIGGGNRKEMLPAANPRIDDDRLAESARQNQYVGNVPESWRCRMSDSRGGHGDNTRKDNRAGGHTIRSESQPGPFSPPLKGQGNNILMPNAIGGDAVHLNSQVHSIATRRRLQGLATAALRRHSVDVNAPGGGITSTSSSTSPSVGHSLGINYPYLGFFIQ